MSSKKVGYWEAVSIGIGGMVGGGIFAVLGLSVQLARGGAPLAFLLAGLIALVTAYSYSRLSITFPSQGGTVAYLDRAFGSGLLTGMLNILLWISYIIMLSLYAFAFGSYGAALFQGSSSLILKHILISTSILVITGLNLLSARLIGNAEDWIVLIKISILLLFIGAGIWGIDQTRLTPVAWSSPLHLFAGGMIIFLAYEGFELIANTAKDIKNPRRTLPRAFFSAVGFVIILYILVSIVTVGNLPVDKIVGAKDYALAEAARPFLGKAGYILIAIAALLSTASAINATLYGAARLSYIIAKDGELPKQLTHKIWHEPIEGLFMTSGATLIIANLFDLSNLSVMGSAGFLLIFAAVNGANVLLASKTSSKRWISVLGIFLCLIALASLIWQTAITASSHLLVLVIMLFLSFIIEAVFRLVKKRDIHVVFTEEQRNK